MVSATGADYHPATPEVRRYPNACPACFAVPDAPCTDLSGRARQHPHRSRGSRLAFHRIPSRSTRTSNGKRNDIARRDGLACWICGLALTLAWEDRSQPAPENYATLDHVVPRSLGGRNGVDNLRLACLPCNQRRGTTPADEVQTYRTPGVDP